MCMCVRVSLSLSLSVSLSLCLCLCLCVRKVPSIFAVMVLIPGGRHSLPTRRVYWRTSPEHTTSINANGNRNTCRFENHVCVTAIAGNVHRLPYIQSTDKNS